MHHQQQIPISPNMRPQQWVGPHPSQSSQAQNQNHHHHHHQQQAQHPHHNHHHHHHPQQQHPQHHPQQQQHHSYHHQQHPHPHPQQLQQQQQQQQQLPQHHQQPPPQSQHQQLHQQQPAPQQPQPRHPPQQQQPSPQHPQHPHSHPQQQQQQQQPQQQQLPPPQQHPPPPSHLIPHPQAPPHPILINQQYPNPNFLYPQMGHTFVPPTGHLPQYDHSPTASHQPDPVSINSQQPVSLSNHHPGPLPQMAAVISSANTGTTNVHPSSNGPMLEAHLPRSLHHLNQQAYMIPNPYLMLPYPLTNLQYTGGHLPPHPNPAMMPVRMSNDIISRQPPYDLQTPTNPIPPTAALAQPSPGAKPPVTTVPPPTITQPVTPSTPIKPREKKALAIVDPVTKHVFSEAELKGSSATTTATTPLSQSSKDSGVSRISPKDPLIISEKESFNDDINTKSICNSTSSETPTIDEPLPEQKVASIDLTDSSVEKSSTIERNDSPQKLIADPQALENGTNKTESIKAKEENELSAEVADLSLSTSNQASDDSVDQTETTVRKQLLPNLPYEAGQFSPLNPHGRKKYSIEFLRAILKLMDLNLDSSSAQHQRLDFVPHYMNQGSAGGNYYASSQPSMRRSSQQVTLKPRRVITTHSLQQEVELKTAEKPWKPELETEKKKNVEGEMDTSRLLKVFRGHLNKLTPQKYDNLIEKIAALDLNGPERRNSVIDLVFDKAVDEPGFCELYARMCKVIAHKDAQFCFHLVKKCQEEFETYDLYDGLDVEERKVDIEKEPDVAKKKLMSEELYEDMRLRRKKYLGTIKLIGEMYKFGLLLPKIIGLCMNHLIEDPSNENIECLCSLITTVGKKMSIEQEVNIRTSLTNTIDILHQFTNPKKQSELFTLESRIKFKILDTIDLCRRDWRPRMVEDNPMKIEDIHKEANDEKMRQQHQNHSNQYKNLNNDRNRRPGFAHNTSYPKNSQSRH